MSASPSPKKSSKGGGPWEAIISELNDRSQMEELRPYLKSYGIFPRDVDPDSCTVKIELLQVRLPPLLGCCPLPLLYPSIVANLRLFTTNLPAHAPSRRQVGGAVSQ